MLQFIFRITLVVSIAAALLAVEFNSFHKAIAVKPVQVVSLAQTKKLAPINQADLAHEQSL